MGIAGVLGIVCYFVIHEMIIRQAYLARETTASIVETSLKAPSQLKLATTLGYCIGGIGDEVPVLPCLTGPDAWVQAPSTGGSEMFVATRLKDFRNGTAINTYVRDPESYTIGVSMTLYAEQAYYHTQDLKYKRDIKDLQTKLVDSNGQVVLGAVTRIGRFDIIELAALARAAGLP